MKVVRSVRQIKKYNNAVVALGVFDGVHLAHRRILKNVVRQAVRIRGRSVVVTFWPHPQEERSLYSLEHRLRLISTLGVDVCIVIPFSRSFSRISAEVFIKKILVNTIGARYVYVGENFKFGFGATGDYRLLQMLSRKYNFTVRAFKVIAIHGQPVSSTYIRTLIARGDLLGAQVLLGRPVSVLGTVISGAAFAGKLGFPTANVNPHHEIVPPQGVYAVTVVIRNRKFFGVCYIGPKPAFAKSRSGSRFASKSENIEVHIFDFNKNLYGSNLEVQFMQKIRDKKRFSSTAKLAAQVKKDILKAISIFPSLRHTTIYAH